MTIKALYNLFTHFFEEWTGDSLKITYNRYHKFFRQCADFAIRPPHTDVCDYCTACQLKLKDKMNDSGKLGYVEHKKGVAAYLALKKSKINDTMANMSDTLCIEFDFAQHLPLPNLNCTSKLYKRLLWMYVFNVHVHTSKVVGIAYVQCFGV